MTNPIQVNSIQHKSNPANQITTAENRQALTSSSSTRAGMRRMRTETWTTSWPYTAPTSSYGKLEREVEDVWDDMLKAFRQGNYAEALAKAEHLEGSCDNFVERVEFVVQHFLKGQFAGGRAYFLALMQKKDALPLCESGFDKLNAGLDELLTLIHDCGWGRGKELADAKEEFERTHRIYRGFIELGIGEREKAIADLKSAVAVEKDDIEGGFFYKVLEQKLGTTLLPAPTSVDPADPISLFWAGRYEEAVALIPEHPIEKTVPKYGYEWHERISREANENLLKGACLALLGRTSEALLLVEKELTGYYNYDQELMILLTYLQKGDFAAVKSDCVTRRQTQFVIPVPLFFLDNRDFLRHLLPLAIRGFENTL